ncbi:MAG: hypothetical protein SNJ82_12460, partial [Gemmataceae bacterium]
MAAVCSMCSAPLDSKGKCLRCGYESKATTRGGGPRWLNTTPGRLFIGLIVSQGLFYAMERLFTGLLLASQGGTVEEIWANSSNVIWLQLAQLLAVLMGGILAGGGQEKPIPLGVMVGAWNGVLSLLFQQLPGELVGPVALYSAPIVHAVVALSGSLIGSRIWRPVVTVEIGPVLGSAAKKAAPPKPVLAGRIAWVRVILGTVLAVSGYLYAELIFEKVLHFSGGKSGYETAFQDTLIIWELRVLAVVLGGLLAGMITTNGLKQGLLVGLGTSVVLM